MSGTNESPEKAPQNDPIEALSTVDADTPVKSTAKARNVFVPGRKRKTARTRALERTRRFTGARTYRKEQKSGE